MAHNVFKFIAVKEIKAEHPIGSGIIVTYGPGDDVPANEWGRATDNLIEVGKIQRVAVLVADEDDLRQGAVPDDSPLPSSERTADEVNAETANEPPPASSEEGWPRDHGRGDYELSDGSHVYGKNKAESAQAELDASTEGSEGGAA